MTPRPAYWGDYLATIVGSDRRASLFAQWNSIVFVKGAVQQCDGECAAALANEDSEAGAAGAPHHSRPPRCVPIGDVTKLRLFWLQHRTPPLCAAVVLQGPVP